MIIDEKLGELLCKSATGIVSELIHRTDLAVRLIKCGGMTYKYVVDAGSGDRLIVRFYPPTRSFVVDYEPDLIKRCCDAGMCVPSILCDSRSGPHAPLNYLVYRMIPGTTLEERYPSLKRCELDLIINDLISLMETMTSFEMTGWGEPESAWKGASAAWLGFLRQSFEQGLSVAHSERLLSADQLKALETIYSNLDAFRMPAQARLVWADISLEHIILDEENRLAGLIDFEGALAADPLLNVGYLVARYHGTVIGRRFFDRWTEGLDTEALARIQLYAVLKALRILQHGRDPLPTGMKRMSITEFLPGFLPAVEHVRTWMFR